MKHLSQVSCDEEGVTYSLAFRFTSSEIAKCIDLFRYRIDGRDNPFDYIQEAGQLGPDVEVAYLRELLAAVEWNLAPTMRFPEPTTIKKKKKKKRKKTSKSRLTT